MEVVGGGDERPVADKMNATAVDVGVCYCCCFDADSSRMSFEAYSGDIKAHEWKKC
ncbi:hypothetical protein HanRHA438_Chr14g0659311 [Helianthus annuus]|nr:hypothetical protein HanIR_Chr14g0703771 [Helianthus annuus]KAJ0854142.1 hypothetical protein HanRHA438_Chr14g0659311 [Helianthus annuus]